MVDVFTNCCTTKEICVNEIIMLPHNLSSSAPLGKVEINLASEPLRCVSAYVEINKIKVSTG